MSQGTSPHDKDCLCGAARPRCIRMRLQERRFSSRGRPSRWHLSQGRDVSFSASVRVPGGARKFNSVTGPLCVPAPWLPKARRIPAPRESLQGHGDALYPGKRLTKMCCEGTGSWAAGLGAAGTSQALLGGSLFPPVSQAQPPRPQNFSFSVLSRYHLTEAKTCSPVATPEGGGNLSAKNMARKQAMRCFSSFTTSNASQLSPPPKKGKQVKDYFSCRFTCQQSGLEPDHPVLPPE